MLPLNCSSFIIHYIKCPDSQTDEEKSLQIIKPPNPPIAATNVPNTPHIFTSLQLNLPTPAVRAEILGFTTAVVEIKELEELNIDDEEVSLADVVVVEDEEAEPDERLDAGLVVVVVDTLEVKAVVGFADKLEDEEEPETALPTVVVPGAGTMIAGTGMTGGGVVVAGFEVEADVLDEVGGLVDEDPDEVVGGLDVFEVEDVMAGFDEELVTGSPELGELLVGLEDVVNGAVEFENGAVGVTGFEDVDDVVEFKGFEDVDSAVEDFDEPVCAAAKAATESNARKERDTIFKDSLVNESE